MARIVLIIPTATYRASDFITAARAVGAQAVVASEHRLAGVAGLSEASSIVISLAHPQRAADAIVAYAREYPVDAVIAVDDQGVVAASLAAEALGLSHNPPPAVAATRDKSLLRARLGHAGVVQPDYRVCGPGTDAGAIASELGFPCVVKPVSLSASRGVIKAESAPHARECATRIRRLLELAGEDGKQPLLIERYVGGAEVAVEGLLRSGQLEVLAIFDKPDTPTGPYFEETLLVTPSRLGDRDLAQIKRATAAACDALGLREGPIHAELRVDRASSVMLELAARSIGGLCSRSLRFGLGMRLEEVILRAALGRDLDGVAREAPAAGVLMLPIPHAGTLSGVGGQSEAASLPGIAAVEITIPSGREVTPLPEGDRYLGFVFAKASTPDAVEESLRQAWRRLEISIDGASG